MGNPEFYTDEQGRVRGPLNGKKSSKVGAVVVATAVAAGSFGAVGTTTTRVAGSAPAAAVEAAPAVSWKALTRARQSARSGKPGEAWRQLGLRRVSKIAQRPAHCVVNAHGEVQEFLARAPCRSLERALITLNDDQGNMIVVSIAWVRLPSLFSAVRFRRLIDVHGTGDVAPLPTELVGLPPIEFTAHHYGSRRAQRTVVTVAETEPAGGRPSAELLDVVADVASHLPELR